MQGSLATNKGDYTTLIFYVILDPCRATPPDFLSLMTNNIKSIHFVRNKINLPFTHAIKITP